MSVGRHMSLRDFKRYVKDLRKKLVGADAVIVRGVHSGVMQAVTVAHRATDMAQEASPNGAVGAVDTGDYKRRWRYYTTRTGGGITNDHPAADVIERGRRGGRRRPPVDVIKRWAQRRIGLSESEAELAKWPIAQAIARRGLWGRRVITNSFTHDEITRVVMQSVKHEIREALQRLGGSR